MLGEYMATGNTISLPERGGQEADGANEKANGADVRTMAC